MTKILKLRYYGDDILITPAKKVDSINDEIVKLTDDMVATMIHHQGIGLAAPQVGFGHRIIVFMDVQDENNHKIVKLINPEITETSKELSTNKEGCLSMPSISGNIKRPEKIKVIGMDEKGQLIEITAQGITAACIQHEIDHINGIMFIDRMPKVKRMMVLEKYNKTKIQSL